jgi:D-glycero-alpha-D-manno-heptose-7-phosphate kinase
MTVRPARAAAPTRVDLAGGTLDIWPICAMVEDALTVNVAIRLLARAEVAPRRDHHVEVVSTDRARRVRLRLPLDRRHMRGPLSWLVRLVDAFAPDTPLTLSVRAEAPAGAGLGGSSALGIAVGAALAAATGARPGRDALLRRVQNLETREIRVPTGSQDYLAALWGGLSAFHYRLDGIAREALPHAEALEERLVLAYTGEPRQSGFSNWDMFRRYVDGEKKTVRRMEAIAALSREMSEALRSGAIDEAGRLLGEEARLRYALAPSVATPALLAAGRAARRAGALGAKVCGAGGGGCLVAVARAGRTAAVAAAMKAAGASILPAAIAARGVSVSGR